ncbi:MAG: hypothetical protein K9W46_03835 [Candidatus Heimdallarchaeum endolithica]|uniref:Uncharacterized protein n=1 Tax=Candidatus Heimdallarchaeum endolithica TaxID=2876572 RepID=A0A9Y1FRX8_9ARCH|nr:MAG: hypothetical protein K9W46_03835 [Candidatus Heimdallarchaeum endolithica]
MLYHRFYAVYTNYYMLLEVPYKLVEPSGLVTVDTNGSSAVTFSVHTNLVSPLSPSMPSSAYNYLCYTTW